MGIQIVLSGYDLSTKYEIVDIKDMICRQNTKLLILYKFIDKCFELNAVLIMILNSTYNLKIE